MIANPAACAWPLPVWWSKTREALHDELIDGPSQSVELDLFAWDDRHGSFEENKRVLPKATIESLIKRVLEKSPDSVDESEAQGNDLVGTLAFSALGSGNAETNAPQPGRMLFPER
jgi:hypothetical protein